MTFKNKLKDLLSLGSVNISASLIFSFFWIYLASILTKTEYGELGFLISIANVAMAISLMGYRSVVVVYESKNENVFPSSFLLVFIAGNIAAAITFVVTQNIMISFLIIGMVLFNISLSGLSSQQRYRDFSKHKIFRATITVIIALILYEYFGINGILFGYFISTLVIIKDLYPLLKNKKFEFTLLKPKIRFMLYAFANRLSVVFVKWGDKLLIGSLFGFAFLGSYYVAVQFLLLFMAIPQALSIYLVPQESRGKKNKQIKIFSIIISSLITGLLVIIIPYGINTFLPKYEESIIAIQILSIGIIPLTINSILESEFVGKELTKVVLIGSALQAFFYFISIILLGETFGLIGLSSGFVFAIILRAVFYFLFKNKSFFHI